jgi:hypothetical protein
MKSRFKSAGRGLAKTANGRVAHGLSHLSQGEDLFGCGTQGPARDQALNRLLLANRSNPARNALAAAFITKK